MYTLPVLLSTAPSIYSAHNQYQTHNLCSVATLLTPTTQQYICRTSNLFNSNVHYTRFPVTCTEWNVLFITLYIISCITASMCYCVRATVLYKLFHCQYMLLCSKHCALWAVLHSQSADGFITLCTIRCITATVCFFFRNTVRYNRITAFVLSEFITHCPLLSLHILCIQLHTVKCINCIINFNIVPYSYFPHVLSLHILYIQLQTSKAIDFEIY